MSRKSHIQIKIAECLRHTLPFYSCIEKQYKKWVWHAAVCANEHFNDHQVMGDSAIQIVTIAGVTVVVVYLKLVQCMSIVKRVAIN